MSRAGRKSLRPAVSATTIPPFCGGYFTASVGFGFDGRAWALTWMPPEAGAVTTTAFVFEER